VPFDALWLEAPAPVLEQRVSARRFNASDATPAVVRLQLGYDLGRIDWPRLDTRGSREDVAATARDRLRL
jgi:hypothetical protein